MEVIKSFDKGGKQIQLYGSFKEPLFMANDVGEALGMKCIRSVLRNMDSDWKVVVRMHTLGGDQYMTFLTEPGLYSLIMRSNKTEAKAFQKWVCEEVLPSIRKTGSFETLKPKEITSNLAFKIETEFDLHTKLINFIKARYHDVIIMASLGENQTTSNLRIKSKLLGYEAGSPDILILNHHKTFNGLAIELKSPKGSGVLTSNQSDQLDKFRKHANFKTVVSNNYDELIETVIKYFENVRIPCQYCSFKAKSNTTLLKHEKYFHKIHHN